MSGSQNPKSNQLAESSDPSAHRPNMVSSTSPSSTPANTTSTSFRISSMSTIFGNVSYRENDSTITSHVEQALRPIIDILSRSCVSILEKCIELIASGHEVSEEVVKDMLMQSPKVIEQCRSTARAPENTISLQSAGNVVDDDQSPIRLDQSVPEKKSDDAHDQKLTTHQRDTNPSASSQPVALRLGRGYLNIPNDSSDAYSTDEDDEAKKNKVEDAYTILAREFKPDPAFDLTKKREDGWVPKIPDPLPAYWYEYSDEDIVSSDDDDDSSSSNSSSKPKEPVAIDHEKVNEQKPNDAYPQFVKTYKRNSAFNINWNSANGSSKPSLATGLGLPRISSSDDEKESDEQKSDDEFESDEYDYSDDAHESGDDQYSDDEFESDEYDYSYDADRSSNPSDDHGDEDDVANDVDQLESHEDGQPEITKSDDGIIGIHDSPSHRMDSPIPKVSEKFESLGRLRMAEEFGQFGYAGIALVNEDKSVATSEMKQVEEHDDRMSKNSALRIADSAPSNGIPTIVAVELLELPKCATAADAPTTNATIVKILESVNGIAGDVVGPEDASAPIVHCTETPEIGRNAGRKRTYARISNDSIENDAQMKTSQVKSEVAAATVNKTDLT